MRTPALSPVGLRRCVLVVVFTCFTLGLAFLQESYADSWSDADPYADSATPYSAWQESVNASRQTRARMLQRFVGTGARTSYPSTHRVDPRPSTNKPWESLWPVRHRRVSYQAPIPEGMISTPEPIPEEGPLMPPAWGEPVEAPPLAGHGTCHHCGGPTATGGACGASCGGSWWDNLSVFAGIQGYKGPLDQGTNGNFGFQEGFNWGGPFFRFLGIGYQVGLRATQSDLSGYRAGNLVSDDSRNQVFLTTGLFRRPRFPGGIQFGLVWDWLHDDFLVDTEVSQLRGEIGWLWHPRQEVGFWFAADLDTDTQILPNSQTLTVQPIDLYAFYYRVMMPRNFQGRFWGGFTGQSDGLVGGDLHLPLTSSWALATGFNYLSPNEADGAAGTAAEAWSISLQVVWYPSCSARGQGWLGFRPLLPVADNGLFINHARVN